MTYNAHKIIEKSALPEDTVFDVVITHLHDGTVKDFVNSVEKWKDPDSPAINVDMEMKHNDQAYRFSELFTYRNEGPDTVVGHRSKIGKFIKKYGVPPDVGVKVKAMTNTEGFLRLKIE